MQIRLETDCAFFCIHSFQYMFVSNSGYKEHAFMVPMRSLQADFTVDRILKN